MKIIAILFMVLLSSCSTKVQYTPNISNESSLVRNYQLGKEVNQLIGERLIYKKTEIDMLGNIPSEKDDSILSYKSGLVLVDTFTPKESFNLETYNGTIAFLKGKNYYSAYTMNNLKLIQTEIKMGSKVWMIFLPIDKNGVVEEDSFYYSKKKLYPDLLFANEYKELRTHFKFGFDNTNKKYKFISLGKTLNPIDNKLQSNFFEQEIIYMGNKNSDVKILYRENYIGLNKPGFSIALEYNLNDSMNIKYKKFNINVISANKKSIQYKVLSD